MEAIIITFLVASAGGVLASKLKVPAGAMVGAMAAVAVYNIFTDGAYFPKDVKYATQIVSGLFIGCRVSRTQLGGLKRLVRPAIMNTALLIIACLAMGVAMYALTDYSFATCAFACAPGSMVDMSIIAMDMGADTSVVSVLQLVRLLSILGIFPGFFNAILKKRQSGGDLQEPSDERGEHICRKRGMKYAAATLLVALAGGVLGVWTGIPAGALIFSMAAVSVQNVVFENAYMPMGVKRLAQICAGALIGESVTAQAVTELRFAIIPAAVMILCLLAVVFGLAALLHKRGGLDMRTALFACAPGGASDLALIAEDFGASAPIISLIQYVRVVAVVIVYPAAIQLLERLLG